MKLDVNVLRYLSKDEFRVLTAVEMGQKNHEIVPMPLIDNISGLKHGGAFKCLKTLLRHKLLHHDRSKYDGYRLTNLGYDFLALKTLVNRGHISGVGRQIGIGKEADVWQVLNEDGDVMALKLHRLGRTSFRAVKSKRDYLGKRHSFSWLYLSRLAALKEFAFMKALGDHGFPVPVAIDQNRHAVLMSMEDAHPLAQVKELGHPGRVYQRCMDIISQLAGKGLIHCDYNEFNLLVREDESVLLIDFPQMVSTLHPNAKELFERDVDGVHRFFTKKIGYIPELEQKPVFEEVAYLGSDGLDTELKASGFSHKQQEQLEAYLHEAAGEEQDDDEDPEEDGEDAEDDDENAEDDDSEEAGGKEEQGVGNGVGEGEGEEKGRCVEEAEGSNDGVLREDDVELADVDATVAKGELLDGGVGRGGHVKHVIGSVSKNQTGDRQDEAGVVAGSEVTGAVLVETLHEGVGRGELEAVDGEDIAGCVGRRCKIEVDEEEVGTASDLLDGQSGSRHGVETGRSHSGPVSGDTNAPQVLLARQRIVAEARASSRQGTSSRVMQNTNKAKNKGGKVSASNSIFG